jgi:hypothetical protein
VAAGTRRIALIGSSIAEGYLVEYPNTIGARLQANLTEMCGARVEVQNLAALGYGDHRLVLRMEEALALHPNAVLLVVLPFDILDQDRVNTDGDMPIPLTARLLSIAKRSRMLTVARSILFANNPSLYASLYLHNGDAADFLKPPYSAAWSERLRKFDRLVGELSDHAHAAKIPFALAFVPNQAQVSIAARPADFPKADPEALPDALATIAARHGIFFVDDVKALKSVPDPGSLYYHVDGHPSGKGQPLIALDIAEHYIADGNGPFASCRYVAAQDRGSRP